jgi:hypothetical protein
VAAHLPCVPALEQVLVDPTDRKDDPSVVLAGAVVSLLGIRHGVFAQLGRKAQAHRRLNVARAEVAVVLERDVPAGHGGLVLGKVKLGLPSPVR